jgi:hypothetical protein
MQNAHDEVQMLHHGMAGSIGGSHDQILRSQLRLLQSQGLPRIWP